MKLVHILYCCATLLIYSCNNKETPVVIPDIFSDSMHVKGTTLISADLLDDPWLISTMDTLLLIANKRGDTIIDVFNTHGKLIKRVLERGKGALSVRMVASIQPDYNHKRFYVYDLFARKTIQLSAGDLHPELYATYHNDSCSKVYVVNNGFIAESTAPQGRLLTFDQQQSRFTFFLSPPPKIDTSLSDKENMALYAMGIAINPAGTKIATATYNAGLLNMLNITPTGLDSVWSAALFRPMGLQRMLTDKGSVIAHTQESLSGYSDICATDKYIYAIFSGKHLNDHDYTYSNIIHVLSWDGKVRHKLILNQPIHRLTVSQDDHVLYGAALNKKEEPEILTFHLKDILK